MLAPKYIREGLRAIDSLYFAVFNPQVKEPKSMSYGRGRWQVRKWVGTRPRRLDLWNCRGYSEVILTICKEAYSQERGLYDAGYEEMDWRIITAIGESNYWKNQWKKKIADMDWQNERKRKQAEEQLEYESKYAAKKIWRWKHEPTVHLSGKSWRA